MGDDTVLSYLVDSWAPVTEREVNGFERSIKCSLPKDYRAFILKWNGGRFAVPVRYAPAIDTLWGGAVHTFLSFNCPVDLAYRDIEETWRMHHKRVPANTVPIGESGEDMILINTRDNHVLYWERDKEMDSLPQDNQVLLAEDFNTYLKGLTVEDVAERRRNSFEREEPFLSIEANDVAGYNRWLQSTSLQASAPEFKRKLFKTACDCGNFAVVRHLLKDGAIDPRSADACRLADEAGFGEIVLVLLKAGTDPRDFTESRYRPQEYTKAFLDAWKSGLFQDSPDSNSTPGEAGPDPRPED